MAFNFNFQTFSKVFLNFFPFVFKELFFSNSFIEELQSYGGLV